MENENFFFKVAADVPGTKLQRGDFVLIDIRSEYKSGDVVLTLLEFGSRPVLKKLLKIGENVAFVDSNDSNPEKFLFSEISILGMVVGIRILF